MTQKILLFGDGACRGNPGPGGWAFVLASPKEVVERGGAKSLTTNNEMEAQALLEALLLLQNQKGFEGELHIYLDSKYVLSAASQWIYGWAKNGWVTKEGEPVRNLEIWKEIYRHLPALKKQFQFRWKYVPGHRGIPGNERVDEIAAAFADAESPTLYEGSRKNYEVDIDEGLSEIEDFQYQSFSSHKPKSSNAYYLSLLGNTVYRDESWAQCEARVRGTRGAKYKKVHSAEEEKRTLESWGVSSKS